MTTVSVVCVVFFIIITGVLIVLLTASYDKYKSGKKSIMFEQEDRYKIVVVKGDKEYVTSRNLTIDEAKVEQKNIHAYTRIVKEDD